MPTSAKGYYVENISEVALNLSKDAKRLQENQIIDLFSILMGCLHTVPTNPDAAESIQVSIIKGIRNLSDGDSISVVSGLKYNYEQG